MFREHTDLTSLYIYPSVLVQTYLIRIWLIFLTDGYHESDLPKQDQVQVYSQDPYQQPIVQEHYPQYNEISPVNQVGDVGRHLWDPDQGSPIRQQYKQ